MHKYPLKAILITSTAIMLFAALLTTGFFLRHTPAADPFFALQGEDPHANSIYLGTLSEDGDVTLTSPLPISVWPDSDILVLRIDSAHVGIVMRLSNGQLRLSDPIPLYTGSTLPEHLRSAIMEQVIP